MLNTKATALKQKCDVTILLKISLKNLHWKCNRLEFFFLQHSWKSHSCQLGNCINFRIWVYCSRSSLQTFCYSPLEVPCAEMTCTVSWSIGLTILIPFYSNSAGGILLGGDTRLKQLGPIMASSLHGVLCRHTPGIQDVFRLLSLPFSHERSCSYLLCSTSDALLIFRFYLPASHLHINKTVRLSP